jgi:hypothetical protein
MRLGANLRCVARPHLHLVGSAGAPDGARPAGPSSADVGLECVMLALGLGPVLGVLFGARFGPGAAGAGTAIALLAGRELCAELVALVRRRAA